MPSSVGDRRKERAGVRGSTARFTARIFDAADGEGPCLTLFRSWALAAALEYVSGVASQTDIPAQSYHLLVELS